MEEDLRGKQMAEEDLSCEWLVRNVKRGSCWAGGQVMAGDESGDKSDQAESPPPAKANQIFGFKNSSSTISS